MCGILGSKGSMCCSCGVALGMWSALLLSYGFQPVLPSDFHLSERLVILRVQAQLL